MAGLGIAAGMCLSPTASVAADGLIDAAPDVVEVTVPTPGEAVRWEMEARNLAAVSLPLSLVVSGVGSHLFDGPYPLELEVYETATGATVYRGVAAEAVDTLLELSPVPAGERTVLTGVVSLPADAGNEYQEASGTLSFEFRTRIDEAAPVGEEMPETGVDVSGWLWAAGLVGVVGAATVFSRKRWSA
ncbi:hypothetical protein [Agromyces archimandritae]|uniref:LPXTG cell wall anchor domain-containing protein n=1 Tax=Agromyces archimandritae TaxID=2781962 RepID=A0A975IMB1_9MICO|nr:hypothetical protein [Agromyces archimandritae]QTX03322.1 hypothetical protein G127AT_07960 [Agromyces archimandritae]